MQRHILLDLNKLPVEEHGQVNNAIPEEPFVGQCFLSEEEALVFYQSYARKNGFSVRKGRFVFLPSYRNIKLEDEKRILLLKEGGLSVTQIMRVMELERGLRHGELPFLNNDIHNLFAKNHKLHSQNDARELLEYCKSAKNDDPNFQYAFTLDSENRLEHIFWCHAHCFELYQKYGDAVVFDTTYKVNSYDMPFGIFVGIDNNGRTILLGCALLRNEKLITFEWLFKKFTLLMKKSPKTILTDQDPWMKQAIEK
ncbi:hypothetical protein LXL04_008619 [Taraxacum kok-saghyz]